MMVVGSSAESRIRVGGLSLEERWKKLGARFGIPAIELHSLENKLTVPLGKGPLLICDAHAVIDTESMTAIFQLRCGDSQALTFEAPDLKFSPMLGIGPGAWQLIVNSLRDKSQINMDNLIAAAKAEKKIEWKSFILKNSFTARVTDSKLAKRATKELLKPLRWRSGGLASHYIYHPISLFLSRGFVNIPLSPNAITLLATLIGTIGVAFLFHEGKMNAVIGTGLMQISFILDCIDGEIARIRLQTSQLGLYLDSISDELLNAALMIAVGMHLWQASSWKPYVFMGIFSGSVSLLYASFHIHCRVKHGIGFYWWFDAHKPRIEVQASRSLFSYIKRLFWRETFILIYFIAALFSFMNIVLFISTIGASIVLIMLVFHIIQRRSPW
jgi:phosphatidylglycerophosphate synthase